MITNIDQLLGDAQNAALHGLISDFDNNRPKNAVMFVGPSGTGKTTVAQLIAKHLNSAIREVNCSSETGIQSVRDLISDLHLKPLGSEYNIIFLDEVHGLTKSAQNALLTPLEGLSNKTIVFAATTEPDKIIPALLSRFSRYSFKPLTNAEVGRFIVDYLYSKNIDRKSVG